MLNSQTLAHLSEPISFVHLPESEIDLIAKKSLEKAISIMNYSTKGDRTFEQILENCYLGDLGEHVIVAHLKSHLINVEMNNSYDWSYDILLDNFKIELKFQRLSNTFLSFSNHTKAREALKKRNSYDYMLAWKMNDTSIIPWLLIDSTALDEKYVCSSQYNDGWYLKTNLAQKDKLLIKFRES